MSFESLLVAYFLSTWREPRLSSMRDGTSLGERQQVTACQNRPGRVPELSGLVLLELPLLRQHCLGVVSRCALYQPIVQLSLSIYSCSWYKDGQLFSIGAATVQIKSSLQS